MFDSTISLGNLLTIGGLIVFVTMYIVNIRAAAKLIGVRLTAIDVAMTDFKSELKKLQEVIVTQALQSQRIDMIDERNLATGKRVDELQKVVEDLRRHPPANR